MRAKQRVREAEGEGLTHTQQHDTDSRYDGDHDTISDLTDGTVGGVPPWRHVKQRHTTVTHLVFLEIPRLPALTSCSFQRVHLWTVEHYPYKTETADIEVVVDAAQHAVHLAATRVCYEAPITQNAVELRTCSFARTHLHRSMLSTCTLTRATSTLTGAPVS